MSRQKNVEKLKHDYRNIRQKQIRKRTCQSSNRNPRFFSLKIVGIYRNRFSPAKTYEHKKNKTQQIKMTERIHADSMGIFCSFIAKSKRRKTMRRFMERKCDRQSKNSGSH